MARNPSTDESSLHLRRGFRIGALAIAICAGVLLGQDIYPLAAQAGSGPIASAIAPAATLTILPAPAADRRAR